MKIKKKKKLTNRKKIILSQKAKRNRRIVIGVVSLLLCLLVFGSIYMYQRTYHANNLSFKYEILDNDVVLNKDLTNWINKKSKEEGAYSLEFNNNKYIVISQGSKKNNVCLDNILENKYFIKVEYEYIKNNNKDLETKPMIIQIENSNKFINFSKK